MYEVVSPSVDEVRVHQMWGFKSPGAVDGGASFVQQASDRPVAITTSLASQEPETAAKTASPDVSLRPAGILFDRLMEARYPADFAKLKPADWDRWVKRIDEETQAWLRDSTRWTPAVIVVDGASSEGVRTQVEERFSIGGFQLPEGRLDVEINYLHETPDPLRFDELRIVRSTDLDRVSWSDRWPNELLL